MSDLDLVGVVRGLLLTLGRAGSNVALRFPRLLPGKSSVSFRDELHKTGLASLPSSCAASTRMSPTFTARSIAAGLGRSRLDLPGVRAPPRSSVDHVGLRVDLYLCSSKSRNSFVSGWREAGFVMSESESPSMIEMKC